MTPAPDQGRARELSVTAEMLLPLRATRHTGGPGPGRFRQAQLPAAGTACRT